MKFKNQLYPVLIAATHIPELNEVQHIKEGIQFGASVTLARIEDILKETVKKLPGMSLQFSCFVIMAVFANTRQNELYMLTEMG